MVVQTCSPALGSEARGFYLGLGGQPELSVKWVPAQLGYSETLSQGNKQN